jgi:hypothetical protein
MRSCTTYEGLAAIKNWMAATKKKYGHTVAPLELAERGGQSVLKARLAGSFSGESNHGKLQLRSGRRKDSLVGNSLMANGIVRRVGNQGVYARL